MVTAGSILLLLWVPAPLAALPNVPLEDEEVLLLFVDNPPALAVLPLEFVGDGVPLVALSAED